MTWTCNPDAATREEPARLCPPGLRKLFSLPFPFQELSPGQGKVMGYNPVMCGALQTPVPSLDNNPSITQPAQDRP